MINFYDLDFTNKIILEVATGRGNYVTFVKTDSCELKNIEGNSVNFIVWNYTLGAINSKNRRAVITLNRINNSQLVKGLREDGKELENFAKGVGGMEISIYKMIGIK